MKEQVYIQIVFSRKAFITMCAHMWFLTRMATLVSFHTPLFGKALSALIALIRLLTRVNTQVPFQSASVCTAFITLRTFIRLLTRLAALMAVLVSCQIASSGEASITGHAFMNSLTRSGAQVLCQIAFSGEASITAHAFISSLTRVDCLLVYSQTIYSRKAFITISALMGLLTRVTMTVSDQRCFFCKVFIA